MGKIYPDCLREVGTRFHSSRLNGEKAAVATVAGSWGRMHGCYFTQKSLESGVKQYGKLPLSSFTEILF